MNLDIQILDRLIETQKLFDYAHGLNDWELKLNLQGDLLEVVVMKLGEIKFEIVITPVTPVTINIIDMYLRSTYIFPFINN